MMYSFLKGGRVLSPKVSEAYKSAKKKEMIEAAKNVFIEKGFIHTSMQDVMDRVGVSRGSLYSYFTNIEEIFMAVLAVEDNKDIQAFDMDNGDSQWIRLRHWIERQQDYIEKIDTTLVRAKAEFFLSSNYANTKENYPYISQRYNRIVEVIEALLDQGVREQEFYSQQPLEPIARYIVSFINGLMLDTFQLGYEQTQVKAQLSILLFSLEKLLNPNTLNKE